ncbi:MAG: DinB family protein [Burkholderiales bacterium]|nr:DinB family protein [Burkholderiales bacterium]
MLTRYNAWANQRMFDAVARLPQGEAVKPRASLFRNMVHTLNHNYVIDRIWQAHLEGREHGYDARNTADHPPLDELWRLQQAVDGWYVDWSDRLSAGELREPIRFTLIGGNRGEMTRAEILLHILGHRHYHRGFVCDIMFAVPARPPTMDLPVYLRERNEASAQGSGSGSSASSSSSSSSSTGRG